jgi:hypothetical protein
MCGNPKLKPKPLLWLHHPLADRMLDRLFEIILTPEGKMLPYLVTVSAGILLRCCQQGPAKVLSALQRRLGGFSVSLLKLLVEGLLDLRPLPLMQAAAVLRVAVKVVESNPQCTLLLDDSGAWCQMHFMSALLVYYNRKGDATPLTLFCRGLFEALLSRIQLDGYEVCVCLFPRRVACGLCPVACGLPVSAHCSRASLGGQTPEIWSWWWCGHVIKHCT